MMKYLQILSLKTKLINKMKNIFLYLCIIIVLSSCTLNKEIDYVLFSGTIQNATVKEFSVTSMPFNKKISIQEDGSFSDTLNITKKGFYSLRLGRNFNSLYLSGGGDLVATLDMANFDSSISFTGSEADVNNYLIEKKRLAKNLMGEFMVFYALDEDAFLAKSDSMEIQLNALLSNPNFSDYFKSIEVKNNYFDKVSNQQQYIRYHGGIIKDTSFRVSENFPQELEKIDFTSKEDYINSGALKMLMLAYYMDKFKTAYESTNDYTLALMEILKDVPNGYVKDRFLSHASRFVIGPNESLKQSYDYFIENTIDEKFKESYTKKYNNLKSLAKGTPSPSFDYENYEGGTTSLADLKGKFVYIDVWATWCSPCKKEIPYLLKVEKEFHRKNIAFVSISVDKKKDHEVWRKMIAEKGLAGIQLFADNDRSSKFYKDYKITGIPRFILIDTEGNIISADAPRPSNPKLVEKLNSLLNESL